MSTIKVNTVETRTGSTLTLGKSGDTVSIASGASTSGMGRAGAVDWQTSSIKTGTFTAANGEGYFCDTSSSAFTVNLPAGSAGAIVAFSDYTRTFGTNKLTIAPNGSEKIGGVAEDAKLDINGQATTLVYVDATEGWINVQNAEDTEVGQPPFLVATGGTITTSGDCKIHTFTSPGTFQITNIAGTPANNVMSHMVIAGGGGAGANAGGGGGAGGFREAKSPVTPYTASPLDGAAPNAITATVSSIPITIGAGGAGACAQPAKGSSGSTSTFSSVTSAGGGGGGSGSNAVGGNGGSGGGARSNQSSAGGSGNTPPVSPPQGSNGGATGSGPVCVGGGGGGATVNGNSGDPSNGNGGAGATTSINATPTAFAGGGGGASNNNGNPAGTGGAGGGGNGGTNPGQGTAGTANTGGGGGGSGGSATPNHGKAGGSGIVIIRYKFQ